MTMVIRMPISSVRHGISPLLVRLHHHPNAVGAGSSIDATDVVRLFLGRRPLQPSRFRDWKYRYNPASSLPPGSTSKLPR